MVYRWLAVSRITGLCLVVVSIIAVSVVWGFHTTATERAATTLLAFALVSFVHGILMTQRMSLERALATSVVAGVAMMLGALEAGGCVR